VVSRRGRRAPSDDEADADDDDDDARVDVVIAREANIARVTDVDDRRRAARARECRWLDRRWIDRPLDRGFWCITWTFFQITMRSTTDDDDDDDDDDRESATRRGIVANARNGRVSRA